MLEHEHCLDLYELQQITAKTKNIFCFFVCLFVVVAFLRKTDLILTFKNNVSTDITLFIP